MILSLAWISFTFALISANPVFADRPADEILSLQNLNQHELEDDKRSERIEGNCENLKGCKKVCLLKYAEDENGCPICDCKKGGIFENDIYIGEHSYPFFARLYGFSYNEKQADAASSYKHFLWPKTGLFVTVPYEFAASITRSKRENIQRAIEQYNSSTCIRFKPRKLEKDYIKFVENRGCMSSLGRVGGKQEVSIGSDCVQSGFILHELMHVIGFWHEQSRADRDKYITILWNNIRNDKLNNFRKRTENWKILKSKYDIGSVMHYRGYDFSKLIGVKPTIIDKNNRVIRTQRVGFSAEDIRKINRVYQCKDYQGFEEAAISTTIKPTGNCVDLRTQSYCRRWSIIGLCWFLPNVRRNCVKTCTGCKVTTPTATITTTTTTATLSTTATIPTTTTTTTENTAITSISSPIATTSFESCVDKNKGCIYWTKRSYCNKKFVDFMKSNCPESCGYCLTEDTTTAQTSTTINSTMSPHVTTSFEECADKERKCQIWARKNYCTEKHVAVMKTLCPYSCGYCKGQVETTSTAVITTESSCKDMPDRSGSCSAWVARNYCKERYVAYMQINCRKSCGFCGKTCGTISANLPVQRIVGGSEAPYGSIPWMVNLRRFRSDGRVFCGGALISNKYVVTAAHCFFEKGKQNIDEKDIYAFLGKHHWLASIVDAGEQNVTFSHLKIHDDYNDNILDNDIALLKLSSPVMFTEYIQPICLPNQGEKPISGIIATVSGWGKTSQNPPSPLKTLQKTEVEIISNEQCRSWLDSRYTVTSSMFCAGYKSGGKDACQGDSGGPLTVNHDEIYTLVGLVSWGVGCGREQRPGVYTQVSGNVDWIKNNTNWM